MKRLPLLSTVLLLISLSSLNALGQQQTPPPSRVEKTTTAQEITKPERPPAEQPPQEKKPKPPEEGPSAEPEAEKPAKPQHFDMTEVPPVQTRHQITIGGKTLRYTATAGRLPIKDPSGNIEAQMFFVAYTLDGADAMRRPVTFAFNGGPGSASLWLHMGVLGPRRVVLQPDGWMPAAPYRLEDNQYTPLEKTDLVLVDAIGTGFSRPADTTKAKKFWAVRGDIEAFGEFVRMYISRYERWASPLYLLGESYGSTRAAGVAGYLADKGISFNGITLLSMVLNFETLIFTKTNDVPYPLVLPSYTMIAAYHKKLAPELMQDLAKTRAEAERWAMTDYWNALNRGDALTPQERMAVLNQLARYTGLKPEVVDWADLRVDVRTFTHYLLSDRKLRVGRLDGRYTGPDPEGFMDTPFHDPTGSSIAPPFTSVFNNYVRTELNYKVDMPYYVSARDLRGFDWNWAEREGRERGLGTMGFPDTASALRAAMVKNPYLKVQVMQGYYDLATPYFAANYTMDHLNLPEAYRKNISYATYDSGHMVYLRNADAAKMKRDFEGFIDATLGAAK
ncbi:MAG: S10 family peptidase [Terriglobales bacterium]